jgi:hypothetical protein
MYEYLWRSPLLCRSSSFLLPLSGMVTGTIPITTHTHSYSLAALIKDNKNLITVYAFLVFGHFIANTVVIVYFLTTIAGYDGCPSHATPAPPPPAHDNFGPKPRAQCEELKIPKAVYILISVLVLLRELCKSAHLFRDWYSLICFQMTRWLSRIICTIYAIRGGKIARFTWKLLRIDNNWSPTHG